MKTVQLRRNIDTNWQYLGENIPLVKPLVLVFGSRYLLEKNDIYQEVREIFKDGEIVFGSSAGDISSHSVDDDGITITAIEFEKSNFEIKIYKAFNYYSTSTTSSTLLCILPCRIDIV